MSKDSKSWLRMCKGGVNPSPLPGAMRPPPPPPQRRLKAGQLHSSGITELGLSFRELDLHCTCGGIFKTNGISRIWCSCGAQYERLATGKWKQVEKPPQRIDHRLSDWVAGEQISRGEVVYWEPSNELVWRLDVDSVWSKRDQVIGIAVSDASKGDVVEVVTASALGTPEKLPTEFACSTLKLYINGERIAETVTYNQGDGPLDAAKQVIATSNDRPNEIELVCRCGKRHKIVGDIGRFDCECGRKWWQDGTAWYSGSAFGDLVDEMNLRLSGYVGAAQQPRKLETFDDFVDAFGGEAPAERPLSRHQARLAKHSARRPLPGDKRAKTEKPRRRWLLPAIGALLAAALAVVSALDGGLGLYDRWRDSTLPEYPVAATAIKAGRATVSCDCPCEYPELNACCVLRDPNGDPIIVLPDLCKEDPHAR
ncbi:MAG: hypothetical protein GTN69_03435 [Armatimonadetes bacterium]|nr:hypothetical protein [Armatimonadota bacterium]